jgi:hypothetical protein
MFNRVCDNCDGLEERVFTDSWTGQELCIECLAPVINQITMSPQSDKDNLKRLLREDGRTLTPAE